MIFIHYKKEDDYEENKNQEQKKASVSSSFCMRLILSTNSPNLLSTACKRGMVEHKGIRTTD